MLQELWAIFPLFETKHKFFKNSFLPSIIIEWNNLDPNLETLRVFQSLRKKYLTLYDLPQTILFIVTNPKGIKLITRLSHLR